MMHYPRRGFALLIAVILTSVVLAVGIALLDIAYKQVVLASGAKNSQIAFYNADSALECALYWDQKSNAFGYAAPLPGTSIICDTRRVTNFTNPVSGGRRTTSFDLSCPVSGISAHVEIYKQSSGNTDIYANGFSSCSATDPTRIERGLKAHY